MRGAGAGRARGERSFFFAAASAVLNSFELAFAASLFSACAFFFSRSAAFFSARLPLTEFFGGPVTCLTGSGICALGTLSILIVAATFTPAGSVASLPALSRRSFACMTGRDGALVAVFARRAATASSSDEESDIIAPAVLPVQPYPFGSIRARLRPSLKMSR